eukprot:symbB.v1.2.011511.t1/scaffold777.1/size163462/2
MLAQEIHPDVVSYNAALNVCASNAEGEAAQCFMEDMNNRRVAANAVTCNTCLKLCATLGDGQGALAILKEMPTRYHLKADLISFNTVMEAVEVNDLDMVWQHLRDTGLQPDMISYKSSAFAFAQATAWQRVLDLLEAAEVREVLYQDALTALAKAHQEAPVSCTENILKEIQANRLQRNEDDLISRVEDSMGFTVSG